MQLTPRGEASAEYLAVPSGLATFSVHALAEFRASGTCAARNRNNKRFVEQGGKCRRFHNWYAAGAKRSGRKRSRRLLMDVRRSAVCASAFILRRPRSRTRRCEK